MSCLVGCPVVDCTVLTIYNSIFNSQWVKSPSGGHYVLQNMQTTDPANYQQNQIWQFRWLLWSCGNMCTQKGCLCLKKRQSNSCLFSIHPSHYSHLHTQWFPSYLHWKNPVCYMNSRKRARDRESQPNSYQFNCLLHVLAFGKATIRQLKKPEHSFKTAGCSVEGVSWNQIAFCGC